MNLTRAPHASWRNRRRKVCDRLVSVTALLAVIIAVIPLVMLLYYVLVQGLPALNPDFFTKLPKPVGEAGGGIANAIVGTLILVGLASLLGLPIGILGGIYLAEFGNNRFGNVLRFLADVLASVPSIVIGVLVYSLVVAPMKQFSALAGGIALGIMMIPTITRTTEDLVRMVPVSQREAALSLGASHFKTVFTVVMSSARAGVITGVLLAIARIAGETAPLLFTAMGNRFFSVDIMQPMASLPVVIYTFANSPYDSWREQAWGGALVLILLILLLSVAARYATRGRIRLVR